MQKNVWNINGGQVNIANDHGIVNASQNNVSDLNELNNIIKNIMDSSSGLSKQDANDIMELISMIQYEITKSEPQKNKIIEGIRLIAPMITIANGFPILVNNLQKFKDYVMQYI